MFNNLSSSAESRLLNVTLEDLNKQREKAGIQTTNVNTVYNSRTAEANAARTSQPTRSTSSAVTDPAAASMQRLRDTQAYLAKNTSVDPTGALNAQALEGQKLAEGYKAPTNPGNEEYYRTQAGQLAAAQAVGQNSGMGLQSSVTSERNPLTGFNDPNVIGTVQAASQSGLEQSAIRTMRENGATEDEIRGVLSSPEFKENIRQTMSNTGLGGTARQSAVLTPAQAQQILATSRNPKERDAAQAVIDGKVASVKGYAPRTTTDKDGTVTTTYSEDAGATANAQQKERERLALEAANRLKSQENAEKLKKFVAGVDTKAIDQTKEQIDSLLESIKGLSPDLQAAVLPQLLSIQESNNDITKQTNDMLSSFPSDKEIEASYGTVENFIASSDAKYKAILEKNLETSKEVAQYNKDTLEIEKKIIDHDAAVAEQKQMVANAEGEKKLRRQLNRLGIQTDVSGLTYLQSEIQKGVTALENLKTGNNLVSLKAQLAIGEGYRLEVKQALGNYEANYLDITTQTTEKLMAVKNSISTAKSERAKGIREAYKWGLEQKAENDKEARTTISNAYTSMIASKDKIMTQDRADARADARLESQEKMAFARLQYSENKADERAARTEIQDEKKDAKLVYADFKTAEDQPEVKNYVIVRDAYAKAKANLDAATAGGKKLDIGVAKEIVTVLHEKSLDPTSVVREGEYLRASKGQGWFDNLMLFANAVKNNDRTGITVESAQAFMEAMERSTETQRASALSRMAQPLNRLMNFNTGSSHVNIDPREAATIPELIRAEDLAAYEADQNTTYNYDYGTYSGMKNDTFEEDPKVTDPITQSMPETGMTMDEIWGNYDGLKLMSTPASQTVQTATGSVGETLSLLAPVTQGFDTPISTANYKASTVKAWGGKHDGLDLAFAAGSFVPSMTEGTIESVEYNKGGWGLTVVVRAPDGAEIRYAHLASVDPMLKVGDTLTKGREFAQVGNTGNVFSTSGGDGTHLDFRIKKNGKYIDPFTYTA